jgi:hypothetical protein
MVLLGAAHHKIGTGLANLDAIHHDTKMVCLGVVPPLLNAVG